MSVDTAPLDAPAALGAEALEFPPPATAPSPRPDGLYGQRIPIGRRRLLAGRVAGCVAILAGLQYIAWRVSTVNGAVGIVFWAAEAINLLGLVATVALIWRAPGRSLRPVSGHRSLDVFVTVCGEPPEMVRETLVAALAIGLPHETYVLNDGRLAGKAGWEEIDRLAADMGVTCFTRVAGGVGKAANLNHAVALTNGDVIVTIDADHHAVPDLGQQLLGYFSDPRIAFVSTPQQYYGADDHALNNRELFFYRVIQPAKDASNSAFSCGNGVAYRRAALETVGGFSEWNVVEDVHTSYQLHAAGWHSAYHNHAVTTGVAPPTLAELARQRLRWATDSARLLFWDNPLRKRGLTVRQRLHYLHTAGFYLLAGTQLVFVISPALYLIGGVSIMRVDGVGELLWRSVPYYLALVAFFLAYCSPGETLRMVRQQLVLAPVYVLAVIRGLIGRPVRSGVTEKTKPASVSWVVLFTIGLMGLSLAALADAAISKRTGTVLAAAWAAWFCFALGGPVAAVSRSGAVQRAIRLALYLVILALLAVAVIPRPRPPAPAPAPPPAPAVPEPVTARLALAAPAHGVYLGVFNPAVVSTPGALTAWDRQHGTPARIVNSYQQWFSNDTRFHPDRAEDDRGAGRRTDDHLGAVGQASKQRARHPPAGGPVTADRRRPLRRLRAPLGARRGGLPRAAVDQVHAGDERRVVPVGVPVQRQHQARVRARVATRPRHLRQGRSHQREVGVGGQQLRRPQAARAADRELLPGSPLRRLGVGDRLQLGSGGYPVAQPRAGVQRHARGAQPAPQADHDLRGRHVLGR